MTDHTVPGVYIEESSGLSLSIISGATAIPVFSFDKNSHKSGIFKAEEVVEIGSWLDVTQAISASIVSPTPEERKHDEAKQKEWQDKLQELLKIMLTDLLYQSLKTYFDNGGGRCYLTGVEQLEKLVPSLDDITLMVQAGSSLDNFKSAVAKLCKPGATYFALYDGPQTEMSGTKEVSDATKNYDTNPYAAVYYPWLKADKVTDIPPSAAVAGVYCAVDRQRGVWKAPANVELKGGVTPKYKISDMVNGECNVPTEGGKSINVIREFRGTGPLIWGARTLESNKDTWRYVPVRRLFNAAEKDIRHAMSVALFEPNSHPTWERTRSAIDIYLYGLWQQGALLGSTPEEAYFVQIGKGVTMTETDIKQGKMIVKVGLAAVRPAEFIILQLTQEVVPA